MNELIVVNADRLEEPITDRHIYIDRHTALKNPFQVRNIVAPETACELYRPYLLGKIEAQDPAIMDLLEKIAGLVIDNTGLPVYLVCYCAPHACHGDVIRDLILETLKENSVG